MSPGQVLREHTSREMMEWGAYFNVEAEEYEARTKNVKTPGKAPKAKPEVKAMGWKASGDSGKPDGEDPRRLVGVHQ